MVKEFAWDARYAVRDLQDVLTPALIIYPDLLAVNIDVTLGLLGGQADRWRPHVKTAKLGYTMRTLVSRGVRKFKCATGLELLTACQAGADDVLLAYPSVGANARRIAELAADFPGVRVSVLIETEAQTRQWRGTRVGIFVDVNPGMDRTGVQQSDTRTVVDLLAAIANAKLEFRGLHYYDGQLGKLPMPERMRAAHQGYDQLLKVVAELENRGLAVPEVITSGTPTFPASVSYEGFRSGRFVHRVSPGTVVYCDATSLSELPSDYGYAPAALVVSRVVSHPRADVITCDAGHKTVSADAGVPTCVVVGHPELTPFSPSEEHLPMRVALGAAPPVIGEELYLLPRHVCPTVNNFDHALLARGGEIISVERVTARGREAPILHA